MEESFPPQLRLSGLDCSLGCLTAQPQRTSAPREDVPTHSLISYQGVRHPGQDGEINTPENVDPDDRAGFPWLPLFSVVASELQNGHVISSSPNGIPASFECGIMTERATFLDAFYRSEWAYEGPDDRCTSFAGESPKRQSRASRATENVQSCVLSCWSAETNPPIPRLITSCCDTGLSCNAGANLKAVQACPKQGP